MTLTVQSIIAIDSSATKIGKFAYLYVVIAGVALRFQ